jgi:uncharacterized protein YigA (DUF484 family)
MDMTLSKPLRVVVASVIASAALAVHAEPQVAAAAKNVEATAAEVTALINAMTNAQNAKDARTRLTEAFKRFNAANAALEAAFGKARPKNDAESNAMEKAMEQVQKAASSVDTAMNKATERSGVGGEVGSAMKAAETPKANKP